MRVILINQGNGVDYNHNPPLGALYLAASLRRSGHVVELYDQGAKESGLKYPGREFVESFKPDIVGFSLYTFGLPNTYAYMKELKGWFPKLKIMVGGHHATALPLKTMEEEPLIDYLVCGEGEETVPELLRAISSGAELSSLKGIYYRDGGGILFTPPRERLKDIDSLPFPANDLIEKYSYPSEGIKKGKKVLNLLASRGCPFTCAYCNKAVYGSSYRQRSPKNVVDEIEYMFGNYGYDEVMFHDELFTVKKDWMYELFGELKRRGLSFPWRCLGRVGTVKYDDLVKMKENGCYIIAFGLEAGNDEVRRDIGRKMDNGDIINTFKDARKAGIVTYAFNMINHRKDTLATIKDTYDLMCEVNAEFAPVFICSPLPGSPLYRELPENLMYDWNRFNSYRDFGAYPISISSVPESDLVKIAGQMEAFYYSRFAYFKENVLGARAGSGLRMLLFKFWSGHLVTGRLKHLAKDKFIITGKKCSIMGRAFYGVLFSSLKALVGLFKWQTFMGFVYKKMTQGYL